MRCEIPKKFIYIKINEQLQISLKVVVCTSKWEMDIQTRPLGIPIENPKRGGKNIK